VPVGATTIRKDAGFSRIFSHLMSLVVPEILKLTQKSFTNSPEFVFFHNDKLFLPFGVL
jgi:hypothetical protein